MKFSLSAMAGLAGLALAQGPGALVCPTATRTIQNRGCRKTCAFSDCTFQTTIQNPCGCPSALPTATLIAPCEADCPYQGCDIEFRTGVLPCPTTPSTTFKTTTTTSTTTTRRWPWPPTTTTSTTSPRRTTSTTSSTTTTTTRTATAPTGIIIITSVVTLPTTKKSTSPAPPCPTVTRTTSPADCAPVRCPVPTCIAQADLSVPCRCTPKTVLYVAGCATACPDVGADGCLSRTRTVSLAC